MGEVGCCVVVFLPEPGLPSGQSSGQSLPVCKYRDSVSPEMLVPVLSIVHL